MIAGVILAAGASTRLGSTKALLHMNGESLVRRTARQAIAAGLKPIWVVVGHEERLIRAGLAGLNLRFVTNADWRLGLGRSIRLGIEAVEQGAPAVRGALLMVCDQPLLDAEHLHRLRREFDRVPGRMVASAYAGTVGTPALFERTLFADLKRIEGDRGASALLRRSQHRIVSVPWSAGEFDIDRPEDLERVRGSGRRSRAPDISAVSSTRDVRGD